jgi:hypothetical protein
MPRARTYKPKATEKYPNSTADIDRAAKTVSNAVAALDTA